MGTMNRRDPMSDHWQAVSQARKVDQFMVHLAYRPPSYRLADTLFVKCDNECGQHMTPMEYDQHQCWRNRLASRLLERSTRWINKQAARPVANRSKRWVVPAFEMHTGKYDKAHRAAHRR